MSRRVGQNLPKFVRRARKNTNLHYAACEGPRAEGPAHQVRARVTYLSNRDLLQRCFVRSVSSNFAESSIGRAARVIRIPTTAEDSVGGGRCNGLRLVLANVRAIWSRDLS